MSPTGSVKEKEEEGETQADESCLLQFAKEPKGPCVVRKAGRQCAGGWPVLGGLLPNFTGFFVCVLINRLQNHPFVLAQRETPFDVRAWAEKFF
jgi:hypothetical protein